MCEELTNHDRALDFLKEHLQQGTLVLFLGSGASSDMGLPEWVTFVNDIREKMQLDPVPVSPTPSAETLQIAADEAKEKCESDDEYFQLLKECLYKDLEELTSAALRNDLLTALGALLMGSKRGNVRRVVTLNFDSMIEWFLSMYGFVTRVIYSLPELEGSEDVRVYHPHGFLPHDSLNLPGSDFVILGLDSVNKRLGKLGDPWFEMTRHILKSGFCLFVGLSSRSFLDRSLAPLLAATGDELRNKRPTGIWMLMEEIDEATRKQFLRNNVVPLVFETPEAIVDFLLEICRKAAHGGIRVH